MRTIEGYWPGDANFKGWQIEIERYKTFNIHLWIFGQTHTCIKIVNKRTLPSHMQQEANTSI